MFRFGRFGIIYRMKKSHRKIRIKFFGVVKRYFFLPEWRKYFENNAERRNSSLEKPSLKSPIILRFKSGSEERTYEKITIEDLKNLKEIALEENENFFRRNPHLSGPYHNALIGICLCQDAASHYLNPKVGLKDYDILFFYLEKGEPRVPYRARYTLENGYKGKRINFFRRGIPKYIFDKSPNEPGKIILNYLLERNTKTKKELLKKAVIGLFPEGIFGQVIWKGK